MNTPIRARLSAFVASILVTFTVVHVIANYARPVDEPTQLALRQAASPSAAADRAANSVDDPSLVAAVETR